MEGLPTDCVRHTRPLSHPGREALRGCRRKQPPSRAQEAWSSAKVALAL